ncbi:MAG: hypothetical protein H0U74_04960 [Bradymonadaceae bacterium]|nr:hypothetical protein [Lujinxingiaceae bacterium]
MSDHKKTQATTTTTTTTTTQRAAQTREQSLDILLPEEEKVLRMHHGLSEGDDHELKFAVGANDDTRVKLAMIEQFLIESMKTKAVQGSLMIDEAQDSETKRAIIAKLLDK